MVKTDSYKDKHYFSLRSWSVDNRDWSREAVYERWGNIIFIALFWECSIWSDKVEESEVCQTWHAYSNTGRIKIQKIVNKSAAGAPFRFQTRRAYNLLLALAHMLSTWIFHVRLLEIVISKSLKLFTISSEMLLMLSWSIADGIFRKDIRNSFVFFMLEYSIIGRPGNDFICSAIVYILV
jgi:hypothetical protein